MNRSFRVTVCRGYSRMGLGRLRGFWRCGLSAEFVAEVRGGELLLSGDGVARSFARQITTIQEINVSTICEQFFFGGRLTRVPAFFFGRPTRVPVFGIGGRCRFVQAVGNG